VSLKAGSIELTLIYGKPGELGRTTEPQKYSALLQRMHSCFSVLLLPAEIGIALLKAPGLSRARIKQSDGTTIEGSVRCLQHNYFELVEDHQPA
jgi:hypothetical protein